MKKLTDNRCQFDFYTYIYSGDPLKNPTFYNWNVAFLWYCDGGSYAGDLTDPYVFNGTTLYSRGARIWESTLQHLEKNHNLKSSKEVVLYGESAGGTGNIMCAFVISFVLVFSLYFS
jgi:hypothetical protein